ncbi:universal stress protein [Chitinophaga sedimenti]|uniref:universal stress protein n=1 Tax=Chitinophaga sedimenti TaxID=2033606 RepID=UPI00200520B2|nr:universal stress protein [Chitinophaga sedimenti]MCK7557165.1 universal stress protein [Chitinophaga sedimenti]
MKKIVIAFDAGNYSHGAFEMARRLNEPETILLTGVFLPQMELPQITDYTYGSMGAGYMTMMEQYNAETVAATVAQFESDCVHNGIEYRVHRDVTGFSLDQLQKETRYADLLILGHEMFYANLGTDHPNDYLTETLHRSECPVLVTPEHFRFPSSLILAYDGSADSIFAIKSFAHLFPELCTLKTTLIFASKTVRSQVPDADYIEELCARHFPDLTIEILQADPKNILAPGWPIKKTQC